MSENENRSSIQLVVTYPSLDCSVCRRNSFSYPWSSEVIWRVDALPILLKHARPGRGYDHTYEIAGAMDEDELAAAARVEGWIIAPGDVVCPRCQGNIMRLHSAVRADHEARLKPEHPVNHAPVQSPAPQQASTEGAQGVQDVELASTDSGESPGSKEEGKGGN